MGFNPIENAKRSIDGRIKSINGSIKIFRELSGKEKARRIADILLDNAMLISIIIAIIVVAIIIYIIRCIICIIITCRYYNIFWQNTMCFLL